MFNITTIDEIGIESSRKKELSVSSQSCQCDPYYTRDAGIQHPIVSSIEIQSCTDDSTCPGSGYHRLNEQSYKNIDLNRLNVFLKKVEALTKKEIRKSIKNDEDWKHINRIHGTSLADARCLHRISSDHLFTDFEQTLLPGKDSKCGEDVTKNKFIISGLTWNCSSSMIAVSYGVDVDHSNSWCSHESFLCLWSLFRMLDPESRPSITLTIDGCITCTSAHPNLATIYSIGTRSGKVFVVNTRFSVSHQTSKSTASSQKSFFSSSGNYTRSSNPASIHHTDAVSSIHWIPGTRLDHQQLVSIGMDGKIFVWLMDGSSLEEGGEDDTKDLILSQAFVILVQNVVGLRPNAPAGSRVVQQRRGSKSYLPSSPSSATSSSSSSYEKNRRISVTQAAVSSSSSKTESSSPSELGIISSSFSREDPYNFLVGCIGGSLFLCSLDTNSTGHNNTDPLTTSLQSYNALQEAAKNIPFHSPIRISYVSHRNNVNSVEFCSTSRNLFLSGSIDGEVRVYCLLDIKPLAVLHVETGLRSVSWSIEAHEIRQSSSVIVEGKKEGGSSEFETFLYCLLQNGLLASFRFSLVIPQSSSSYSDENNKLHPVPEFPLPNDDHITQGLTYFAFNHFGKKCGEKLISIGTGNGEVSIWQLL